MWLSNTRSTLDILHRTSLTHLFVLNFNASTISYRCSSRISQANRTSYIDAEMRWSWGPVWRRALIGILKPTPSYLWCLERSSFNSGEHLTDMTRNRGYLHREKQKPYGVESHLYEYTVRNVTGTEAAGKHAKEAQTWCVQKQDLITLWSVWFQANCSAAVLTCSVRLLNSCTALGKSLSIKSCQKVKIIRFIAQNTVVKPLFGNYTWMAD